jgi:hypothetical protein
MSDKVVFKLFWDFEKEESWLNAMAAKGLNLMRYSWGMYRFEAGAPGEWIYRIELLPKRPGNASSKEYLGFMTEAGVETVTTYMSWVYFRKPAADGPFELFTDLDSRIVHYKRVLALFATLTAVLATLASANVVNADRGGWITVFVLTLTITVGVLLAVQTLRLARRVSRLKGLKQLYD